MNKDFSGWAVIFEDQVPVSALLDRLLQHVVLFDIEWESNRIKGPKKAGEKHNESDD